MKLSNVVVPLPTQVGGSAGTAALNDAASQSSWAMTRPGFADATAEMERNAAMAAASTKNWTALTESPFGVAYLTFRSRRGVPQRRLRISRPAEHKRARRKVIGATTR